MCELGKHAGSTPIHICNFFDTKHITQNVNVNYFDLCLNIFGIFHNIFCTENWSLDKTNAIKWMEYSCISSSIYSLYVWWVDSDKCITNVWMKWALNRNWKRNPKMDGISCNVGINIIYTVWKEVHFIDEKKNLFNTIQSYSTSGKLNEVNLICQQSICAIPTNTSFMKTIFSLNNFVIASFLELGWYESNKIWLFNPCFFRNKDK